MSIYASRDYSAPVEIQGSGVRQFSEVTTNDFILTRMFVQKASVYKPLLISTADYQYKNAFLVDEIETKRDGYAVWLTRIYATIPSTRTEYRSIAFTFPGQSALVIAGNGGVVKWSKYGAGAPSTALSSATVTISYSMGAPFVSAPTQVLYNGQPVDFCGNVYTDDGSKLLGQTSPLAAPSSWVISDTARRWKGNIFERERVTI